MSRTVHQVLILAAVLSAAPSQAGEWHVDTEQDRRVEFTSTVVGYSFSGTNNDIDGFLYWEGDELFERDGQVYFEVDLRTLDTGIAKRDRDMRDVLDARQWPRATYAGEVLEVVEDTSGVGHMVRTQGPFTLKGVEQEMEIVGWVRPEGDQLSVESEFTVRLSDHEIEAPGLVAFVRVSDKVVVRVQMHMRAASKEEQ